MISVPPFFVLSSRFVYGRVAARRNAHARTALSPQRINCPAQPACLQSYSLPAAFTFTSSALPGK